VTRQEARGGRPNRHGGGPYEAQAESRFKRMGLMGVSETHVWEERRSIAGAQDVRTRTAAERVRRHQLHASNSEQVGGSR
jgi:hypothetical protein